jgi:hypothetical protein
VLAVMPAPSASRDAVLMPHARSTATNGKDAHDELTVEQASCLAVTAVTADLEYWARTAATGDGRLGLNDLVRILDAIRLDSTPEV